MADNDIVRRGYLNVVQKPKGGVVRRLFTCVSTYQLCRFLSGLGIISGYSRA